MDQNNGNHYYSYGSPSGGENVPFQPDGPYEPQENKSGRKKNDGNGFWGKLAKCASLALVFGLVAGTAFKGTTYFFDSAFESEKDETANEKNGADLNIAPKEEEQEERVSSIGSGAVTDVSGIVKNAMPSIVSITNMGTTEIESFFGQRMRRESESRGSGIIISQDENNLYIVTNNHVVEGAQTLTVCFEDNSTVSAQVKGKDQSTDLAVVSVPVKNVESSTLEEIRVATFGDSNTLKVGQSAVAIGNALGYGQSVTTGVISALEREVTISDQTSGNTITNQLIQTDAAINPGNSGGALLNLSGEVIGINSVKYADTAVEGIGYAIPVDTAIPIIQDLITRERVRSSESAYLGISGIDVTAEVAETYQRPRGVYVVQVIEGTAAAEAGITQGDIITKFDGRSISSMTDLQERLNYYKAGTTIEVTIQRAENGIYEEMKVNVTLGRKQ